MVVTNAIGFNKPFLSGNELKYIQEASNNRQLAGMEYLHCNNWLEKELSCSKALLTILYSSIRNGCNFADINEGDEVIMPSFTFVSSANAFVLRGATPVFVDVRVIF